VFEIFLILFCFYIGIRVSEVFLHAALIFVLFLLLHPFHLTQYASNNAMIELEVLSLSLAFILRSTNKFPRRYYSIIIHKVELNLYHKITIFHNNAAFIPTVYTNSQTNYIKKPTMSSHCHLIVSPNFPSHHCYHPCGRAPLYLNFRNSIKFNNNRTLVIFVLTIYKI
jgi:hypothetical protein